MPGQKGGGGQRINLAEEVLKKIRFFGRFGDISPIWDDHLIRSMTIQEFVDWIDLDLPFEDVECEENLVVDRIVGIETRGAVLGGMVAIVGSYPFSMIRRGGKLHSGLRPIRRTFINYKGEEQVLEISPDHIRPGEKVVIVDDWFETGASAMAAAELIKQCGAEVVGFCGIVNDTSEHPEAREFFAKYHYFTLVDIAR